MKLSIRFIAASLPLLLAACVSTVPKVVHQPGDAQALARQQAREQQLAYADHWVLQGKISIYNGDDGGPGNVTWTQAGDHYDFLFRTPITGKSFRLSGGPDGALLEGVQGGPVRGPDAEALMRKTLGWDVPLAELRAWVLGVREAGSQARLEFGADGLPSMLSQDGWTVTYPSWDNTQHPPLPGKVFAEKPPYKVRLSIQSWSMQ